MTAGTVVVVVVVTVSAAVVVTAASVVGSVELSGANALTDCSVLTFCTTFPHDWSENIENTAVITAAIFVFALSIPIPPFVWIYLLSLLYRTISLMSIY